MAVEICYRSKAYKTIGRLNEAQTFITLDVIMPKQDKPNKRSLFTLSSCTENTGGMANKSTS